MCFRVFKNLKDLLDLGYGLSAAQYDGTFKIFVVAFRIENADLIVLFYESLE